MQQYTEAQGVLTGSINSMYQNFSTSFKKHIEAFNEFGLPFKDKRRIYSMLSKFADLKLGIQKRFGETREPIAPTDDAEKIEHPGLKGRTARRYPGGEREGLPTLEGTGRTNHRPY